MKDFFLALIISLVLALIINVTSSDFPGQDPLKCSSATLVNEKGEQATLGPLEDALPCVNEDRFLVRVDCKEGEFSNTLAPKLLPRFSSQGGTDSYPRFLGECYAALENGKWGIVDAKGMRICETTYDAIEPPHDGKALAKRCELYGYLDKDGHEAIPFQYKDAHSFSEGLAGVRSNEMWGFIDPLGKSVIPSNYSAVENFSSGLAWVVGKESKGSYIDRSGVEVFPDRYGPGSFHEGRMRVDAGFVDTQGVLAIPHKYDEENDFFRGWAKVRSGGKWGAINKAGEEIVPCKYDEIEIEECGGARIRLGEAWGYVNDSGEEVIKPQYSWKQDFSPQGVASVGLSVGWGLINRNGEAIHIFSEASGRTITTPLNSLWAAVVPEKALLVPYRDEEDGRWGFKGADNQAAIPPQYDSVSSFSCGLASVRVGNKWGFIGEDGKFAIPPKYDDARRFWECRRPFYRVKNRVLAPVKVGEKWGYIDKEGKFVIEPTYDDAGSFFGYDDSRAMVAIKGLYGYIDQRGKLAIPPAYDYAMPFQDGKAFVWVGSRWGQVDLIGTFTIVDGLFQGPQ